MPFRYHGVTQPLQSPAVAMLSVVCPHCHTPLARVPRTGGELAACFSCGLFGEYRTLSEQGVLDGGILSEQEIEDLRPTRHA